MRAKLRARFCIEVSLAMLSGSLLVLTLFWRDWIEAAFGIDPDRHSGSLEWALVASLLLATALFVVCARFEYRRSSPTTG
jgi:hypothetical protein